MFHGISTTLASDAGKLLGGPIFQLSEFAVVARYLDHLDVGLVVGIKTYQVPLVDPGTYVLPHFRSAEPLKTRDVWRVPSVGLPVHSTQGLISAVQARLVGWHKWPKVRFDVPHPHFGEVSGLVVLLGVLIPQSIRQRIACSGLLAPTGVSAKP